MSDIHVMATILRRCTMGVAVSLLLAASPAWGQGGFQTSGTAYYRFARPGQNTVQVVVLGGGKSGIYEVGENIDIARLLALSGWAGGDGRSKSTVRLYRPENGRRELIFEAKMKDFVAKTDYPDLKTGDVIQVETVQRSRFGWRDVLQIVTTATTLVFTFERFLN